VAVIIASLVVNVVVAGFFGVVLAFGLTRILPHADAVFGPDSPSRRILPCLYLAIAIVSVVAIVLRQYRMPIVFVLFPLQIVYKVLTVVVVRDLRNPVPWCNLAISVLHGASLWVGGEIAASPRLSSPRTLHSCALHFSTGRAPTPALHFSTGVHTCAPTTAILDGRDSLTG
jgi:hypothetical protein